MKITSHGQTDVGRKRGHNEDSFLINESLGLYIVADGMGGHNAGEVASRMAVDIVSAEVNKRDKLIETYRHGPSKALRRQVQSLLSQSFNKACKTIYDAAKADEGTQGMGTTMDALLIFGRSAFIAHVGDSRVYLVRAGQLHQITEDHSLINEQLKTGLITEEEAKEMNQYKNVITRGVGVLPNVEVDTLHLEIAPDDKFLLCSDGLHEYVKNEEIPAMFEQQSLNDVTRHLIQLANDRGGKDNITAVTVAVPDWPLGEDQIEVDSKLQALKQIPLFTRLSYQELVKALNIAQLKTVQKGDMLIREGDPGDSFYIIVNGMVDVLKEGIFMTSLEKGGHFGEMALVNNSPRSATVRAAKDSHLLVIERTDFYQLLHEDPHLSVKILLSFVGVLSDRLTETTRTVSEWRRKIAHLEITP